MKSSLLVLGCVLVLSGSAIVVPAVMDPGPGLDSRVLTSREAQSLSGMTCAGLKVAEGHCNWDACTLNKTQAPCEAETVCGYCTRADLWHKCTAGCPTEECHNLESTPGGCGVWFLGGHCAWSSGLEECYCKEAEETTVDCTMFNAAKGC